MVLWFKNFPNFPSNGLSDEGIEDSPGTHVLMEKICAGEKPKMKVPLFHDDRQGIYL